MFAKDKRNPRKLPHTSARVRGVTTRTLAEDKPDPPDLPKTLLELLERQSPDCLDKVSAYARKLACWKRTERERELADARKRESITDHEEADLREHGIPTDPQSMKMSPPVARTLRSKRPSPGTSIISGSGARETPGKTSILHLLIRKALPIEPLTIVDLPSSDSINETVK